ncbi:hypothetical protein BA1_11994 [Bacillus xiamenensis]|nr:hypothetical protein BA1_11994 [Bacillus xiamenensis]
MPILRVRLSWNALTHVKLERVVTQPMQKMRIGYHCASLFAHVSERRKLPLSAERRMGVSFLTMQDKPRVGEPKFGGSETVRDT